MMNTGGVGSCIWQACARVVAALALLFAVAAQASVRLPNGEYRETVTDLRVKVLGGYVAVERTWLAENINKGKYRWYVNPAWADLTFEYDSIDDSVKSVRRADSTFERAGNDVFVFERVYFIEKRDGGWRWYDRDGNWVRYDADGRMTAYGDRNDVIVRFTRGPNGPIDTVTDHHGNPVLTFGYTGDKLTSIVDRTNRKVTYRYEGDRIVEVVDAGGNRWMYAYTDGLLTQKTDPESHATTIAYSGNRVVKVTDPLQHTTTYEYAYDRGKRQHTVVEKTPEGRRTETRFDSAGRRIDEKVGVRRVYGMRRDGDHVRIVTDERGLDTRSEMDVNGNIVKIRYPDGTVKTRVYHEARINLLAEEVDEAGTRTAWSYDQHGNVQRLIEAAGTVSERTTTFVYDTSGQRTKATIQAAGQSPEATTLWTYDEFGNVATKTNAEGAKVEFTYDVAGNALTRKDSRGKTWTTAYDARGLVVWQADPLGNATVTTYDRAGNRVSVADPLGRETKWSFDANNRLVKATDAAGAVTEIKYDRDGNKSGIVRADGTTESYFFDTDGRLASTKDAAGKVVEVSYGTGDEAGLLRSVKFPTFCIDYKYDLRGRRTVTEGRYPCSAETHRERSSADFDAMGRLVSKTDEALRTTLYRYDALGRLVEQIDAASGSTSYEYDVRNNRISVRDPLGAVSLFRYDRANRRVEEVRPLGGATRYEYDAAGNLVSRTSPEGRRQVYEYNDAGSVVVESYFPAASNVAEDVVRYTLDRTGRVAAYSQRGTVSTSAEYEYDAAGRTTAETTTYGLGSEAFTRKTGASYTPAGSKKTFTYADGTISAYDYRSDGKLASVTLPVSGMVEWKDYGIGGAGVVDMPGATRIVSRDPAGRTTALRSQATGAGSHAAPTGETILDLQYRYEPDGNIAERRSGTVVTEYSYDALEHLASAKIGDSNTASEKYTYDGNGNRLTSEALPGDWTYNADGQLVEYGIGGNSRKIEYDADGNTVAVLRTGSSGPDLGSSYRYGATGRVAEVRESGNTVARYAYDPFGRRVRKEVGNEVTWFQYSDEGLVAEYDRTGAARRIYGWEPDTDFGTAPVWLADRSGDGAWNVFLFHNDDLGTPMRLTATSGQVVWSAAGNAFGETVVSPESVITNPIRFAGQYFDDETQLNHNVHRDYDARTSRYLQVDPLGVEGGLGLYVYASANPVNRIDPLGLQSRAPRGALPCNTTLECYCLRMPLDCPEPLPLAPRVGPRVVPPVAPGAEPSPDAEKDEKDCKQTCATHLLFRDWDNCDDLLIKLQFSYRSETEAARAAVPGGKAMNKAMADNDKGDCKQPINHWVVKRTNKDTTGYSVISCGCCKDDPVAGPVGLQRYGYTRSNK